MARTLPLTLLVVLTTLPAAAATLPPIQVRPLRPAAAPTPRTPAPLDPGADALAQRLSAVLARRAAAPAGGTASQRAAVGALRAAVGEDVEVHLRPGVGTPMQIRARRLQRAHRNAFGVDSEATARAFLNQQRALLRLQQPDDELALTRHERDDLGRRHLRYAQRYRGLPVWPAELIVHLDASGDVDLLDGAFVPTPEDLIVRPAIDAAAAVARGRAGVPEGAAAEASAPELIIYAPGDGPARLAWRFTLSRALDSRWMVVVDARDGALLAAFDEVPDANVAGVGVDTLGRERSLNVFAEGGVHFLADTSKPMFDPTSDPPDWASARGEILILDARNRPATSRPDALPELFFITAPSPNAFNVADGVSAAFGLSEVYDYYLERHGRDSLDGNGGNILAIVRLGRSFANAFWSGTFIAFGDADTYAASLDVVAHELTHGVIDYSAQLVYMDQSGALNEAFADVFGESVQARSDGAPDWLLGSDLSGPIRDMADPGRFGDPARFGEFVVTELDNGGVHTNSGIINRAYYLLAEGMPGAIGIGDAERIFYRALTVHLVSRSQFVDARLACIAAAQELFGAGSNQARQTAAAFDAVEIRGGSGTPEPTPFPGVEGDDAALFVFASDALDASALGRAERALGDPARGRQLIDEPVATARPSVSGDGSFAAYVGIDNDVCLVNTDGSELNQVTGEPSLCLGFPGLVHSVAVAPDGEHFGFVLRDDAGNPRNTITVIDTGPEGGNATTYALRAPAPDGAQLNTIAFAQTMDFTADGRFLVYDALNQVQLADDTPVEAFSIYGLDLASGDSLVLVPPSPPLDVGSPALSQRSDDFLTFEVIDIEAGMATVVAANLVTGELEPIAQDDDFTVPGFSGDDTAIVYSQDGAIRRQPIAADRITPQGDATTLLPAAQIAVIYRRGSWVGPGGCAGDCNGDGAVTIDEIVRGVGIALGTATLSVCPTFDGDGGGAVTVDELVRAVNAGLGGCA